MAPDQFLSSTPESADGEKKLSFRAFLGASIGTVAVVYGDIGTSPLYALSLTFFGEAHLERTLNNVLGTLSLFFWSLVLIVTVKYIALITQADNDRQGGTLALLGLIRRQQAKLGRSIGWISAIILFGAALLYGDGIITPAISVLSAVEGVAVFAPNLRHFVVPITVVILIGLFAIQHRGTQRLGYLFGPVMLVWFLVLALLALPPLLEHPEVFQAVNPLHGIRFLAEHGAQSLVILGAVVLCITGSEALYADMGHFGIGPIRATWLLLVFPALTLNYFGQGSRLLATAPVPHDNLFYSLVPQWAFLPVLVLATAATIIASQALITGVYSLTQQAIALGVFPRLRIIHTNPDVKGQIYIPAVNWALLFGVSWLVLAFTSAENLAAMYGIAVTGTMAITTFAFGIYVRVKETKPWPMATAIAVGTLLIGVDLIFFSSNLLKFTSGGYVPLFIATIIFLMMMTWQWGRRFLAESYGKQVTPTMEEFSRMKREAQEFDRPVVILSSIPVRGLTDKIPPLLYTFYRRYNVVPRDIVILTVLQRRGAYWPEEKRYESHLLYDEVDGKIISAQVSYGYMETPDVREALFTFKRNGIITIGEDPSEWLVLAAIENIIVETRSLTRKLLIRLFRFLQRNAVPAHHYLGLGADVEVSSVQINLASTKA